jgi:hypothetical protein
VDGKTARPQAEIPEPVAGGPSDSVRDNRSMTRWRVGRSASWCPSADGTLPSRRLGGEESHAYEVQRDPSPGSHFSHLHGIAGTAFQSSAFSPTLFVGEKVAEGRMRGRLTVAFTLPQHSGSMPFQSGRARKEHVCPILQRPPHPPSAPSPPEKHGGRRRSIGESWDGGVRNAGFKPSPVILKGLHNSLIAEGPVSSDDR